MNDIEQQDSIEQALTPAERRMQAIARCTEESLSKAQQKLEDKHLTPDLRRLIDNYRGGYKRYLPEICDLESALDYLACVIYGMNIEAIDIETGTKLVYAAQVAPYAFRPVKGDGQKR